MDLIPKLVGNGQNKGLTTPFSLKEVRGVIFGMKLDKVPSPDGFP